MNLAFFLQNREHGKKISTQNDFRQKDSVVALVEEQASMPVKNQPCELSGQPRATFLMDFSPDGTKVASTHGDHTVRVTDISTGKCTHVLSGHPRTPWCLGFHPSSNQILASGCLSGEVRIWDLLGGGSEVWHSPSNGVIASLAFHPMDHVLVFATGNTIYFWDWSQPEPFAFCKTNYEFERIRWLRFDPLGHFLYTGIANNTTIQREEPNVVHINEGQRPSRIQQNANRRRYQQVIQRYHDYQQGRLRSQVPPDSDVSGASQDETSHRGDMVPPHSPLHEERLSFARQYASHVTETSGGAIRGIGDFSPTPSHIRSSPYRPPEIRRMGMFQSLRPGTWSPPPRGPSEEDMMEQDEISQVGGAPPRLSERVEVGPQRPLLVRPTSTSGLRSTGFFTNIFSQDSLTQRDPPRGPPTSVAPNTGGINWVDSSRNETPASSSTPAFTAPNDSTPSGLRLENLSSSRRPVSGPNTLTSSSHVSSLSRFRSRLQGSAFREVPQSSRSAASSQSSASGASSTSHAPCEICRTFNLCLLDNRSLPTTAGSHASNPTNWSSATVPTSSSSYIPRSRSHTSSSNRLFHMMHGVPRNWHNPAPRGQTTTADGTSQTTGAMVLPECSDQGTDVIGLGDSQEDPVVDDSRGHLLDEVLAEHIQDDEIQAPIEADNSDNVPCENLHVDTGDAVPSDISLQNSIAANPAALAITRSNDLAHNLARREDLTSLTLRLERQVSELDRRITALRESFTERLRALHQDRERIMNLRGQISHETSPDISASSQPATSGQASQHVPLITITRPRDHGDFSHTPTAYNSTTTDSVNRINQNPHLLEMFLRGDGLPPPLQPNIHSVRMTPSQEPMPHEERSWHALQHRHLHPHYSVSILDETINRPNDALQAAINRAIAGAFMGTGEQAVASNIIPQTHRIQRWDFRKCEIPDITQSKANIVVSHCKLHNDASCDISQDGTFLVTFVPSHRGFPDDNILAVYSLIPHLFGQCLYTKSFGPNAISVSLSPRNQCVMVGLAAKRLSWVFTSNQLVAQVFKLQEKNAGENSMKHMCDVLHPCDMDIRTHMSVNSARWLRGVGEGLVYGTNRGDLHICRPGVKKATLRAAEEHSDIDDTTRSDGQREGTSIRRNLMTMLGLRTPRTSSIATQTITRGIRRTAETQTDQGNNA